MATARRVPHHGDKYHACERARSREGSEKSVKEEEEMKAMPERSPATYMMERGEKK